MSARPLLDRRSLCSVDFQVQTLRCLVTLIVRQFPGQCKHTAGVPLDSIAYNRAAYLTLGPTHEYTFTLNLLEREELVTPELSRCCKSGFHQSYYLDKQSPLKARDRGR